jgi:alanine racemase
MILKSDIAPIFKYRLTPTVCTEGLADILNRRARALGKVINVHVKVDTGMGRLGVIHHDALALLKYIDRLKFIRLEGLFTHFAFADLDAEFTERQIDLFNRLVEKLQKEAIRPPLLHAANSMGTLDFRHSHFNMVRPGLIIYGLYPKEKIKIKLKPVLSLKTRIIYLKRLPKGSGISYGHIYVTKKESTIVTLPIGYGDGYPRNLSNLAPVLIGGRRFQISGRVCMDQIMVDVGDLPVKVGQEVTLIGRQGKNKITCEELAELAGTIPYEIACGLGSRIPRVYVG